MSSGDSKKDNQVGVFVSEGVTVPINVSPRGKLLLKDLQKAGRDAGIAALAAGGSAFTKYAADKAVESDFTAAVVGIILVGLISLVRRWWQGPPKSVEIKV